MLESQPAAITALSNGELNFNLAQKTGQVWIDSVSMH